MGAEQVTYVMTGIRVKRTVLEDMGIDIYDDKFLPYIEGHPGEPIDIVEDSQSEYIYMGEVILKKCCEDYDDISNTFKLPLHRAVAVQLIHILDIPVPFEDIHDWIFTIWR